MDPIILIVGGVIAVGAVALVVVSLVFAPRGASGDVQLRLEEYASRSTPLTLEEIEMSQPFSERVVIPILQTIAGFVTRFAPAQAMEKAKTQIEMAGRPVKSPEIFMGIRGGAAAVLFVLAFLILSMVGQPILQRALFSLIGAVIGFILPGVWLGSKISQRQDDVIKSLPDALDLLVICVEAGLGFEGAMAKVAEKWDNEMAKAFARVLQEIRLGKLRNDALREMDNNIGVPDITSFVAAIIQATQFGVSIAKVLRIQSEQMRIKRRQRAEKKAQEAPIKMLFPMVFLIFPSLFVVLLGPAVLLIMESGVIGSV
jgi:tight adherence protein C